MSTVPNAASASSAVAPYFAVLAETMASVLAQIAGKPCPLEITPVDTAGNSEVAESDVWILVTASGSLRGEQVWRFPATSALGLARTFLGDTETAEVKLTADHRDALTELMRQVAGRLTTALKPGWGEMQLRVEPGTAPSWAAAVTAALKPREQSALAVQAVLYLSPAFQAALGQSAAATPGPALPSTQAKANGNLELLMDVELDLTLRFGQRRMLLREILELGPGSVIELDRQLQEPVELLLDGRLLARGQVVVIEGNYGLEVTGVISSPGQE